MKHQIPKIPASARLRVYHAEIAESAEKACFAHVALLASLFAEQAEQEQKTQDQRDRKQERKEQKEQTARKRKERKESKERKARLNAQCNSHIIAYREYTAQMAGERARAERAEKARIRSLVRDGERKARAEYNQREQDRINRFPALAEWRAEYAEMRENKRIRRVWTTYRVSERQNAPITASGVEYMRKSARIMAYTAIKTAYQNSAHPFLYALMQSAYADRKAQAFRETRETVEQAQELKKRRRKKVAGIWLRSDDEYLSFTDGAKENLLPVDGKAESRSADYDDCVQIAFETLWEMSADMVSFADVWNYRSFVYRAVNSYIMGQRKAWDENQRMSMTEYSDSGEERVISEREFNRTVSINLDDNYVMECVADVLRRNYKGQSARGDRMKKVFLCINVYGMSIPETCRVIDREKSIVYELLAVAQSIANRPEVKQEIYSIVKN